MPGNAVKLNKNCDIYKLINCKKRSPKTGFFYDVKFGLKIHVFLIGQPNGQPNGQPKTQKNKPRKHHISTKKQLKTR
jgi:hypothetical protein